ncbi:MAG: erythromycin biosynthesis sensory transduction protein eryC1 [Chitinivibrionales bacterium]|nr:erythromycin biosynthesis sensory transduction protein eryC1 [Chitinivibrionales bacterium]
MNSPSVPFLDLGPQHATLKPELMAVFEQALDTTQFIGGAAVERFEQAFARLCETRYCVGVGSGTDALRFALIALGIGEGDAVLTVPNTFIATTEAITQAGARPLFVDVDEQTHTLSPRSLMLFFAQECDRGPNGRAIHRATGTSVKAIVPVHLYGQPAEMDPINEVAEEYGCVVLEDACQAHGAEYFSQDRGGWARVGSLGEAAAFSFYPGKNLGACGEAGAVTTNSERIAQTVRMLRDHGQNRKYIHEIEGYNGRLDALQAGILFVKLGYLQERNNARKDRARRYCTLLDGIQGITLPSEPSWARSVYHLYVVQSPRRDELRQMLSDAGVQTGLHYPVCLHLQQAYARFGHQPGSFPIAERASTQILSLPMFPELSDEQQDHVAAAIRSAMRRPDDHVENTVPV